MVRNELAETLKVRDKVTADGLFQAHGPNISYKAREGTVRFAESRLSCKHNIFIESFDFYESPSLS